MDETGVETISNVSSVNHSDRLAYLIYEVYRPIIEEKVDFCTVVSYMPFVESRIQVQLYSLNKMGHQREAAVLFLNYLQEVQTEGKYQSFVDALRKAKYPVIVSALQNEEVVPHEEEHKELVNIFKSDIAEIMDPDRMSEELQALGVISEEEAEKVRNIARNESKFYANLQLIILIPKRLPNWYEQFLTVLLNCDHKNLVKKIDPKFLAKKLELPLSELESTESSLYTEASLNSDEVRPEASLNSDEVDPPSALDTVQSQPEQASGASSLSSEDDSRESVTENEASEPRIGDSASGDFQEKIIQALSEFKFMYYSQSLMLQQLLDKTDDIGARVRRMEVQLQDIQKQSRHT